MLTAITSHATLGVDAREHCGPRRSGRPLRRPRHTPGELFPGIFLLEAIDPVGLLSHVHAEAEISQRGEALAREAPGRRCDLGTSRVLQQNLRDVAKAVLSGFCTLRFAWFILASNLSWPTSVD